MLDFFVEFICSLASLSSGMPNVGIFALGFLPQPFGFSRFIL